jgi:glycosyltransferase involved in cell wall biosynthesis
MGYQPQISIITSTYNRANYFLPRCLESVKKQTFRNFEHIIVDDCSTDNTKKLVTGFNGGYKKLRYYSTDKNSGSDPVPKNLGIKKARGKYIIHLDDDVVLRKDALELLYSEIKNGYDVVYGDMWIDTMGQPGIAHDFDLQFLSLRNYIDTSSALIKKSALKYVGGWDESLPKFIDWNLFIRLAKAGFKFKRLPKFTFDYSIHTNTKSQRVKTEMYYHPQLGQLYVPTFDPITCKVRLRKHSKPKVAIFTIHYNREDYSKETYKQMRETAGFDFDWFCANNGKAMGDWVKKESVIYTDYKRNVGISKASNDLLDTMMITDNYDIIIKIDNDVEFITYGWLSDFVELWESNHLLYASPYVEGLLDFPGGAPRIARAFIGDTYVEITKHIGGIFAFGSARIYEGLRFSDSHLHGFQDLEASNYFLKNGCMPCYIPKHIIRHRDTTVGQHKKYKDYFKKRELEKKETYEC